MNSRAKLLRNIQTVFSEVECDKQGYETISNGRLCVMVVGTIPATFPEAEQACAKGGGRLYEPRDVGSYLDLMEDIAEDIDAGGKEGKEDQAKEFWIGITDQAKEDRSVYQ